MFELFLTRHSHAKKTLSAKEELLESCFHNYTLVMCQTVFGYCLLLMAVCL